MAKKLKHSKIKNTGILFELLTRQITADVLDGKDSKAVTIVKKYFNENTVLGKELQLYRLLSEKHYNSENKANELLDLVIKSRRKLSSSSIRNEKYNLIKEIKKSYQVQDFFGGRISNYKLLASISNVIQSETTNEDFQPDQVLNSKFTILEHITNKNISGKVKDKVLKEYNKKDKDLRLLTYKILVDKFNNKYKGLSKDQKNLLEQYINNVSNKKTLAEFVNKKASTLYKGLVVERKKVEDKVVSIKLKEVIKHLKPLSEVKSVKDKHILNMMRYYDLKAELSNVSKRKNRQVV